VIERVRGDDPSAYLRVMASLVRPASEPEAEDPLANMTIEELKAELLAGLAGLFPELRVVTTQPQASPGRETGDTTQPPQIQRKLAFGFRDSAGNRLPPGGQH